MRKLIFLILFLFSFSTSPLSSFNFLNNRVFKCRKNNYGFEELYKNAKNGVVVVKTPKGSGSGIVIKHHNNLTYILTNSHVVDKYKRVAIVWSNKEPIVPIPWNQFVPASKGFVCDWSDPNKGGKFKTVNN